MTDTDTRFPEVFVPGFMGFATELDFMLDFAASMRDSGLKNYPRTWAEIVAKQDFKRAQPTNFVPTIVKPSEGGEQPTKHFGKTPGTRSGRGVVHAMSPAQRKFILSLLNTKNTTELATKMVRGWTLDPSQIDTISKQHARPFIDALISCPDKAIAHSDSVRTELSGSDKQIAWITKTLLKERGVTSETDIKSLYTRCDYQARNVISELLTMPKAVAPKAEISEGMYKLDERIFKVYLNQANTTLLVKELIDTSFEYVGSAQYKLPKGAVRMTLDEAKHYGKLTGTCCVCSRKLTDENSMANGIGPICEGKF
jgi:hypothetical protein